MSRRSSPRHVLVLGGTGFLGVEIADRYLAEGSAVTVVARHHPSSERIGKLAGATVSVGDVADELVLERALDGADHVVHALGCPFPAESNDDPVGDLLHTIPTLIHLLELLKFRPDVGLTFLSSGGTVYGNPLNVPADETTPCDPITVYGITKLMAEKYITMYSERFGIESRILRVANAYGPLQSAERGQGLIAAFLEAAQTGKGVSVFGDGTALRDYVTVEDVADAVVQVSRFSDGPRILNVGSGRGHSVRDVLAIVRQVTGHALHVDWLPERPFDVKAIVLDVTMLRQLIRWTPVPLSEGVGRVWTHWRSLTSTYGEDRRG